MATLGWEAFTKFVYFDSKYEYNNPEALWSGEEGLELKDEGGNEMGLS